MQVLLLYDNWLVSLQITQRMQIIITNNAKVEEETQEDQVARVSVTFAGKMALTVQVIELQRSCQSIFIFINIWRNIDIKDAIFGVTLEANSIVDSAHFGECFAF